jgi:hypothetical protein
MKKKVFDVTGRPIKTYKLGRVCQHCGEPIADQERASKTHCTRYRDEFGIIHDCKRRKHQLKHQLNEDFLLDWCAKQRETKQRIEEAIKAHGDELTEKMLTAYNIMLDTCIRHYDHAGTTVVEFLGYDIIINPNYIILKIVKNDKSGIHCESRKAA